MFGWFWRKWVRRSENPGELVEAKQYNRWIYLDGSGNKVYGFGWARREIPEKISFWPDEAVCVLILWKKYYIYEGILERPIWGGVGFKLVFK